jgi:hypothetical protein
MESNPRSSRVDRFPREVMLMADNIPPGRESTNPEEEWYDLLPVEKKLIYSSFGLGVVLLIIFILKFVVFK